MSFYICRVRPHVVESEGSAFSAPRYSTRPQEVIVECDELDDPAKQDMRVRKRYLAVMKRFTQALNRGGADCRSVGGSGGVL